MDDHVPRLGQYLEGWLEVQRTWLQPSTWESYRGNVQRYLAPALGDVALDGLTAVRLDAFCAHALPAMDGDAVERPAALVHPGS